MDMSRHRSGPTSRWAALFGGLLACASVPPPALAADLPSRTGAPTAPAPLPGWSFSLNLYGWAAGLEGSVRTLPPLPALKVNIGFDDVLENLNVAVMGTFEARHDRLILFTDLIYSKLSPDKGFTVAGFPGRASIETQSFIGLAAAGYRVIDGADASLDAFVGLRGFAMSNTITVDTPTGSLAYGKDEQWLDGVVGARVRYRFAPQWSVVAMGFVGGGASNYQWDLYGGVSYAFSDKVGTFLGYRAMKVDYEKGRFLYDALQHGPLLGVQMRF
jgi:hypothetical protein